MVIVLFFPEHIREMGVELTFFFFVFLFFNLFSREDKLILRLWTFSQSQNTGIKWSPVSFC